MTMVGHGRQLAVLVMICGALVGISCSSPQLVDGRQDTAATISGSLADWQTAVCLPGTIDHGSLTPNTVSASSCTPREGDLYINFDQFGSQQDMEKMLSYQSAGSCVATTVVGGYPFAIWMPASHGGKELEPLKKFGFAVTVAQRPAGSRPAMPSSTRQATPTSRSSAPPLGNGTISPGPGDCGAHSSPLNCWSDTSPARPGEIKFISQILIYQIPGIVTDRTRLLQIARGTCTMLHGGTDPNYIVKEMAAELGQPEDVAGQIFIVAQDNAC